ncbi:MAG: hypothetical protein ACI9DC_000248 [Gammaproteobacteria bacterium]|jgi:hypothetical protein
MASSTTRLPSNDTAAPSRRVRRKISTRWLIPLAALIAPLLVHADPFPTADALEAQVFKDVRVTLQAPTGWSQQSRVDGDTQAFFVSRDAVTEDGPFQSGISLNVVTFPAHVPQESLNYAKSFAITYPNTFGEGAECGWKNGTPLTLFWCQANIDADDHATTALHHLIANTETGKLYIFMFETLREDWQQSWPTISTMLKSIVVDPAY